MNRLYNKSTFSKFITNRLLPLLFISLFGRIDIMLAYVEQEQTPASTSEIYIQSGKETIYGVLSKPTKTKQKQQPIVIIAHGFNGTHTFGKNYFKTMNDLGYQCFTFDFPCGSVKSLSNNNTVCMSIIDEQQYLEAVVDYFKTQPDVDAEQIILLGESQGGLVAALVAAQNPNIHRLILVFPALCIPYNWNERYNTIAEIPDTTRLWDIPIGRRFFTEIRYLDPYNIIGRYKKRVLIIHGDKDVIVPVEYSVKASKTYQNAELVVIKDEGHGFKPEGFKHSLDMIEKFLKN